MFSQFYITISYWVLSISIIRTNFHETECVEEILLFPWNLSEQVFTSWFIYQFLKSVTSCYQNQLPWKTLGVYERVKSESMLFEIDHPNELIIDRFWSIPSILNEWRGWKESQMWTDVIRIKSTKIDAHRPIPITFFAVEWWLERRMRGSKVNWCHSE